MSERSFPPPKNDSPLKKAAHDSFKERFDPGTGGDTRVFTCDDKAPKESWGIPKTTCIGLVLLAVTTASWVRLRDVGISAAEYALKGFLADNMPVRFRPKIGDLMRHTASCIPYLYVSIETNATKETARSEERHTVVLR